MFFFKSDDKKQKVDLYKVFQALNINYSNFNKELFDQLVYSYGVITNSICELDDNLKVEANNNSLVVKKGCAIFPVSAKLFVDLPDNVERDILVIACIDNNITISSLPNDKFYVILTLNRDYFNEVITEKTYANPVEVSSGIYKLKGKIETIPALNLSYSVVNYKNTQLIKKNNYFYGLILAFVDNINNDYANPT